MAEHFDGTGDGSLDSGDGRFCIAIRPSAVTRAPSDDLSTPTFPRMDAFERARLA